MRGYLGLVIGLVSLVALAWPAVACDVPVFRYALERWEPDAYEVLLVHDSPLDPIDESRWRRLTGDDSSTPNSANLLVRAAEPDGRTDASLVARRKVDEESSSPWIALYYPSSAPLQSYLWAGPLTESNCDAMLDSPARRQIARDLLDGMSAVFVLLESGDSAADRAASETLERELAASKESLMLPGRTDDNVPDIDESKVRIDFSTVRVSRQDPHERIFVEMLLGIEPGLREIAAPMAFPVYGRGRALYALVGKGINPKTLRAACAMLTGPCSCQLKDDNPGVDLLLAVDWDAGIGEFLLQNPEPAAMPSPALLQASAPEEPAAPEELAVSEPAFSPFANIAFALAAGLLLIGSISVAISIRKGRADT